MGKMIAITWPSWVGKSTLSKVLSDDLWVEVFSEESHKNPYLKHIKQGDDSQYMWWLNQKHFLESDIAQLFRAQKSANNNDFVLLDFSIFQVKFYIEMLLEWKYRSVLLEQFLHAIPNIPHPDIVVELSAPIEDILKRRKQRNTHIDKKALDHTKNLMSKFAHSGDIARFYSENHTIVENLEGETLETALKVKKIIQ